METLICFLNDTQINIHVNIAKRKKTNLGLFESQDCTTDYGQVR